MPDSSEGKDAEDIGDRLVAAWQAAGSDQEREAIFREIFETHYRIVLNFFSSKGVRADECQDLTQETFFKVHRGLAAFRRESRFRTWLFQIVRHVFLNSRRSQSTQKREAKEVPLDEMAEADPGQGGGGGPSSGEPQALEAILEGERSQALYVAMAALPAQMRQCVELRVYRDLRYREIALIMQVSIDTVKAHLYQARQHLRKKLSDYFDDDDAEL